MPPRKKAKYQTNGNGSIKELLDELFQAAIRLRGSVEPADYKRYVLPIIFLRFLSLRYEARRAELSRLLEQPKSEYYGYAEVLDEPDKYRSAGVFPIPYEACWENILQLGEETHSDKLKGLLRRIYAGSNLERESQTDPRTGLINLFSKDILEQDHGGTDLIGRIYEYFIGEFASSEGKRGGEYFTRPASCGCWWPCWSLPRARCSTRAAARTAES